MAAYQHLSLKMAVQLAAPHTWSASVIPVVVGIALSTYSSFEISWTLSFLMLIICVLMQSAVNTFNDYFDYAKGLDSKDDNLEPSDAVLLYNNINPKAALGLAIGYLVAAFVLGLYVIWCAGMIPLMIALIGAAIVVLYSAGKIPVSALPIGELVSGIVMGGLITLAVYYVLTGTFLLRALLWSVPQIIGIGLIMMTNNSCDIEKDIQAKRRTLPIVLGRERAKTAYHVLIWCWLVSIVVMVGVWFTGGLIVVACMILATIPLIKALYDNPLSQATRVGAMSQICSLNVALGAFYAASILGAQAFSAVL